MTLCYGPLPNDDQTWKQVKENWESLSDLFDVITCSVTEDWSPREVHKVLSDTETTLSRISEGLQKEREVFDWVDEFGDGSPRLPPSYYFLFAKKEEKGEGEENVDNGDQSVDKEAIEPVGDVFVLTLCQFAKQNAPCGLCSVVMQFFTRLFSSLDIPYLRPTARPYPQTVLLLFPNQSITPLVDLMSRVSRRLDPAVSRPVYHADTMQFSQTIKPEELVELEKERVEYCKFLCALSETIEKAPEVVDYFMVETSPLTEEDKTNDDTTTTTKETLSVLGALLPFVIHERQSVSIYQQSYLGYALSAVLSLARCVNHSVQSLIANELSMADKAFYSTGIILVTLSKVPVIGEEGKLLLQCLIDTVRFLNYIYVNLPGLAKAWRVGQRFKEQIVVDTLLPLFQSLTASVFCRTCLITSELLKMCIGGTDGLGVILSERVLGTSLVIQDGSVELLKYGEVLQCMEEYPEATEYGCIASFYNFYIVQKMKRFSSHSPGEPRTHASPESDAEYWRVVEAALELSRSLLTYSPSLFLKYAVFLPPSSTISSKKKKKKATQVSSESVSRPLSREASFTLRGIGEEAADPFSAFDLDLCFPKKINLDTNPFFVQCKRDIAKETLAKLIFIESHATISTKRLMAHNSSLQQKKKTTAKSRYDASLYATEVQEAAIVKALCNLLSSATVIPLSVLLPLTSVISSLCLLPDERILCTLLNKEYGRLDHALNKLCAIIENQFEEDEEGMFAVAAAAAKVAGDTKKRINEKALLAVSNDASEKDAPKVSERRRKAASLVNHMVDSSSNFFTREYLYRQFTSLFVPPCGIALGANDPHAVERAAVSTGLNDHVVSYLIQNLAFLERCLCVELFRHELEAVVSHTAFSFKLLNLKIL